MNDIREDLKAYIDGELSEARAAEVAAAISADPELAQEAEFMKMLGIEIKRVAPEPAVEGRAATILKVKNARSKIGWSPMNWPVGLQAAAGVAFVAILGTVFFPLLAPAKEAAKATAEMAANKQAMDPTLSSPASQPPFADEDAPKTKAPDSMSGGGGGARYKYGAAGEEAKDMSGVTEMRRGRTQSPQVPAETNARTPALDKEANTTVPMRPGSANRLVVKNADMAVRVDSAAKAMSAAGTIAEGLGGFVISSNSNDLKGLQPSGTVVLRVPATRFDLAMQKLRALGDVTSESSNGEDVTAQVADIGARLKVLKAEEDSYITMLRAARRVSEMLEIKERLSGSRQEIESLTAQITALKDMATLSTITATFEQKITRNKPEDEPKGGFEETWNGAVNGLQSALKFLGSVVIVVFVYSPIWLPLAAIGWWLARRAKKNS